MDYSSSDNEGANSVDEHSSQRSLKAFPIEFFSCSSNNMDSDESNSDDDFRTLKFEDRIKTFEDFAKRLKSLRNSMSSMKKWNVYEQRDGIFIYQLSREPNSSRIEVSINLFISKDMHVKLHKKDVKVELEMLKDSKLELWSQIYAILNHYNLEAIDQMEFSNALNQEEQFKNVIFESTGTSALDDRTTVKAEDVLEGEEEPKTSLDTLKRLELDTFPLCRIKMLSKSDLKRIKVQQYRSSSSKR